MTATRVTRIAPAPRPAFRPRTTWLSLWKMVLAELLCHTTAAVN